MLEKLITLSNGSAFKLSEVKAVYTQDFRDKFYRVCVVIGSTEIYGPWGTEDEAVNERNVIIELQHIRVDEHVKAIKDQGEWMMEQAKKDKENASV